MHAAQAFLAGWISILGPGDPAGAPVDTTGADLLEWAEAPALPLPRDHHGIFAVQSASGPYLYVAGGTDYRGMFDDVSRAGIRADGSLAAWERAGSLPSPRAGVSLVVLDGVAVLTGGQVTTGEGMQGLRRIPEVHTAAVDEQGRLGPWQPAAPLPAPRFHHPMVTHDGWIYVVGGQGEVEAEAGVFGARLDESGGISEWVELTPLPRPRSHHAALVLEGHIYLFGGLDGRPGGYQAAFTDVIRAPINDDGTLGQWQLVSMLPHSYATHSAVLHDGHVWILGGVEDLQRFSDVVLKGRIHATGALGPWETVEPGLPLARGHVHVTPLVAGRVYTAGGRITAASGGPAVTGAVHIGTLGPTAGDR